MNLATIISMISSAKTTIAGVGIVIPALIKLYHDLTTGLIDPSTVWTDITAILGGLGLVAAKDANVTNASPATQVPATTATPAPK